MKPKKRTKVNPFNRNLPKMVTHSKQLSEQAQHLFPGGSNTSGRSFSLIGGIPIYAKRGKGCYLYDYDSNKYIDYMLAQGPLILGHAHPVITKAVKNAVSKGSILGLPTKQENQLATILKKCIPTIQKIRFVNSGTEAVLNAIRICRTVTKRETIAVFDVGYHGYASGLHDPDRVRTLVLPYNDIEGIERILKEKGNEIACVIMEPLAGNMGAIRPLDQIHQRIRTLCTTYGILLIFDEVITGFRFHAGTYFDLIGVQPDLVTLGKIIGGGYPIGAYGGREDLMELVSSGGSIYQGGTFSGHLISMVAGYETIKYLIRENPYPKMEAMLNLLIRECPFVQAENSMKTMFSINLTANPIQTLQQAKAVDMHRFNALHSHAIAKGILLPLSPFRSCYLSVHHTEVEIHRTIQVLKGFVEKMKV